jgi:hypothetical protein
MDDVLQGEAVEVEDPRQLEEHRLVAEAVDVDPQRLGLAQERLEVPRLQPGELSAGLGVVKKGGDDRRRRFGGDLQLARG